MNSKAEIQLKHAPIKPIHKNGTYDQDWEYIANYGNLDECNGGKLLGKYTYFITDTYPFIQRCVFGTADASFEKRGGPEGSTGPGGREGSLDVRRPPPPRGDRPPPPRR